MLTGPRDFLTAERAARVALDCLRGAGVEVDAGAAALLAERMAQAASARAAGDPAVLLAVTLEDVLELGDGRLSRAQAEELFLDGWERSVDASSLPEAALDVVYSRICARGFADRRRRRA